MQGYKSNKIWDGAEDNVSETNVMVRLYNKNSGKMYAVTCAQLLPESTYEQKYNEKNEGHMSK